MITLYLEGMIVMIVTILAVYYSGIETSMLEISLVYVCYIFAATHETFALTTLFDSPKLAGELGSFLQSLPMILYYYLQFSNPPKPTIFFYLACLFPQAGLSFSLMPDLVD